MNTLPLIFVIWCIMDSEVSEMEKDYAKIEQQRLKKGRIMRWKILSIILTVFSIPFLISHHYIHFDVPFIWSVPFIIPAVLCWIIFIIVLKVDTIKKDGYRIVTILLTIVIIFNFIPMLIISDDMLYHEDRTHNISDYTRVRNMSDFLYPETGIDAFPKSIPENTNNVQFGYYSTKSTKRIYLSYNHCSEDIDNEKTALKEKEYSSLSNNNLFFDEKTRTFLEMVAMKYVFDNDYIIEDEHGNYHPEEYLRFFDETDVYFFGCDIADKYPSDYDINSEDPLSLVSPFFPESGYLCGALIRASDGLVIYFYVHED